uniref:Uncharacterized protein n=1 Tax=Ciona savignyi TaxID=51511 RepID=H2Y6U6_CIOSA
MYHRHHYANDISTPIHLHGDDTNSTASSTLKSRIRLSSDSTTTTVNTALEVSDRSAISEKRVWSQDQRREIPATINQGHLTPSMS